MCVPVSVVTGGNVSGCQGLCSLWPQTSGVIALCAGGMEFYQGIYLPEKERLA